MHLGSFIWNCVRVFRVRICYYVTQWSATKFYGSPSVYNRPLPSEKIVPLTAQLKSPSGDPCYDYYHFQLKYPRKAVAYRRKWCHLTCWPRRHVDGWNSKRSPAAGERCQRVDKPRTVAEGNSEMPCGYDEDFVNPIDEDLQCSICYVALREPVLTRCGHRFCKECLKRRVVRYVEHIILLSHFAAWL